MSGMTPMRAGQTDPPAHLRFVDDQGKPYPFPNGTTFQFYIYDPKSNITVQGNGTWNLANIAQGMVDYQWIAADTKSLSGTVKVFGGYTLPSGMQGYGDPVDIQVTPIFVQQ